MRTLPNDPAQGMTKREYFAVTIAAWLAVGPIEEHQDPHLLAGEAIELADALLELEEHQDPHLLAGEAIELADALLELLAAPTIEDEREAERARD